MKWSKEYPKDEGYYWVMDVKGLYKPFIAYGKYKNNCNHDIIFDSNIVEWQKERFLYSNKIEEPDKDSIPKGISENINDEEKEKSSFLRAISSNTEDFNYFYSIYEEFIKILTEYNNKFVDIRTILIISKLRANYFPNCNKFASNEINNMVDNIWDKLGVGNGRVGCNTFDLMCTEALNYFEK